MAGWVHVSPIGGLVQLALPYAVPIGLGIALGRGRDRARGAAGAGLPACRVRRRAPVDAFLPDRVLGGAAVLPRQRPAVRGRLGHAADRGQRRGPGARRRPCPPPLRRQAGCRARQRRAGKAWHAIGAAGRGRAGLGRATGDPHGGRARRAGTQRRERGDGRRKWRSAGASASRAARAPTPEPTEVALGSPSPAPSSFPPAADASAGRAPPGPRPGKLLARIADMTPSRPVVFQDPFTSDPGVLLKLKDGRFVAYDAVCTHAACTVEFEVTTGYLVCPCHGAVFDPARGRQGHRRADVPAADGLSDRGGHGRRHDPPGGGVGRDPRGYSGLMAAGEAGLTGSRSMVRARRDWPDSTRTSAAGIGPPMRRSMTAISPLNRPEAWMRTLSPTDSPGRPAPAVRSMLARFGRTRDASEPGGDDALGGGLGDRVVDLALTHGRSTSGGPRAPLSAAPSRACRFLGRARLVARSRWPRLRSGRHVRLARLGPARTRDFHGLLEGLRGGGRRAGAPRGLDAHDRVVLLGAALALGPGVLRHSGPFNYRHGQTRTSARQCTGVREDGRENGWAAGEMERETRFELATFSLEG